MRILSYNIHKGFGGSDRRYKLDRVIGVLKEINADLICLQEVDINVRRSRYNNQPQIISESLQIHSHIYQLNVPHRQGGYGNLLLSRWSFRGHHHVSLQHKTRKPRGAQLAVIETPEGPLHVINWHLGLAENERRWQVRHLLSHPIFLKASHLPTLITGDFNDWRNSLIRHAFKEHQFRQATAPIKHFRSFPAFFPLASLDKLYHRGPLNIRQVQIINTNLSQKASDHLPLLVDFHLNQTK